MFLVANFLHCLNNSLFVSLFQEFADLNSMCRLETSAKDCTNVEEAFEPMASKLCESHEQYLSFESELSGTGSYTLHGAYGGLSQKLIFLNWRQGLKYWGPSTREYRPSRFIMSDKAAYPIGWLLQGNFP